MGGGEGRQEKMCFLGGKVNKHAICSKICHFYTEINCFSNCNTSEIVVVENWGDGQGNIWGGEQMPPGTATA